MPDTPPDRARNRSSKRSSKRKPRKLAWHEQPWLLPAMAGACAVMLVLVGVVWWHRRDVNPVEQAQASSGEIRDTIQDVYQGDYTLLDHNTLAKKGVLPEGLQVRPDANQLVSAWGPVDLMGANAEGITQPPYTHFLVVYYNIPHATCAPLAQHLLGQYGKVWIGQSAPHPNPQELVASAQDVAGKCQAATVSIMALGQ